MLKCFYRYSDEFPVPWKPGGSPIVFIYPRLYQIPCLNRAQGAASMGNNQMLSKLDAKVASLGQNQPLSKESLPYRL
jgi:hypothetical protein